jgi:beta-glucosidase
MPAEMRIMIPEGYNARMSQTTTRREFGASALLAGAAGMSALAMQYLPRPKFYWGIGIENCWIAQTDGNHRLLDVFLQMQHYDKWKQDLDLLPEAGVNCIRYSVPWYKAEPKPGVYDWSWIDKPIDYLVNKLKIIPVMDIIHYGTPVWMADGVMDDRFPDAIGRYAGAMAAHFKGLINHYSPHNEPELTCLFCGLTGRWPPYGKSVEGWSKIGVRVAKGMVLEMEAIRAALPDAVILSVDPWFPGLLAKALPVLDDPAANGEVRKAAACYPASLAYGRVTTGHPLSQFLKSHGVEPEELAWFEKRARRPDILGYNQYPDIGNGFHEGVDNTKLSVDFTKNGALPVEAAARAAANSLKPGIRTAQAYFGLPVYLTETSAGLGIEARIAYINALGEMVGELRRENVPIVGVNWWPLFDTIQWDYRERPPRPVADFIYEGGWNNGLCVIQPQPGGDLKRVPTAALSAYRNMVRRDLAQLSAALR